MDPTSVMTEIGSSQYIGQKFCDRYQVVRELGRGGMGVVFLAHDEHVLNRRVVIKVLQENHEHEEWVKKKFAEERAALALIDHPGVVGVLDTGTTSDGKPFLVIQFIDGTTLRDEIGSNPMTFGHASALLKQLGSALTAAHDKGICHRDLKPENIMIQRLADGEILVKIIDFGIAIVRDAQQAGSGSKSGVIAGSFPYMAPEQLMGSPDLRSDIFALGVIAWEMLTGKPPEQFRTAAGVMLLKTKGLEKKPRDFRPEIPVTAEAVIVKALSFEPEQRYQAAKELVNELVAALCPSTEMAPTVAMSKTADIACADGKSGAIIAHVLFMDIVGCSKMTLDEQRQVVSRLDQMVRDSTEFQRARSHDELISLPTGDGMALIFCKTLEAPLACAVEVARMLRQDPVCRVRMGIHSGPVFLTKDINGNPNGQGGGINRAERVMSCGTGDHILLSDNVADSLRQLRRWQPMIHDAGECQVKDGWLHVWNFYDDTVGNPALPVKSRRLQQRRRFLVAGVAGAVGALTIAAGTFALWPKHSEPPRQVIAPPSGSGQAQRSLSYSLIVKPPQGPARSIAREMLFPAKYRVKFIFKSTQDGYLYLINEGPPSEKARTWTWLSPDPNLKGGTAAVTTGQNVSLPSVGDGFLLDNMQGSELVYVIWSDQAVPELEAIKAVVFTRFTRKNPGELAPTEASTIQRYIEQHSGKVALEKGETETTMSATGPVFVKAITLEHL